MRRAAWVLGVTLAACGGEEIDPAFRKEIEMVCESPIFGFGNLRLRTAQGRKWQEKLNDAPMGQRPMVAMREAKRVGLKRCGAFPPELLGLTELPAVGEARPLLPLAHYDAREPPLLRGADATWGDVVSATPAGEEIRFAAAYGMDLRTLAVARDGRPPLEQDQRMTVAVTRQQLAVWAPSGYWQAEDPPVLVLSARADGTFDTDALGRMFEAMIAARDRRNDAAWSPYADTRFHAADDVPLRAIAPVLPLLQHHDPYEPGRLVLRADAPTVVAHGDRVRLSYAGILAFTRTEAEHTALRTAVRERIEAEYLPSLAACRGSWPEAATTGGSLIIELAVTPTGDLHHERSVRGFGFPALDACVLRAVEGWRLPPRRDETYNVTLMVAFGV